MTTETTKPVATAHDEKQGVKQKPLTIKDMERIVEDTSKKLEFAVNLTPDEKVELLTKLRDDSKKLQSLMMRKYTKDIKLAKTEEERFAKVQKETAISHLKYAFGGYCLAFIADPDQAIELKQILIDGAFNGISDNNAIALGMYLDMKNKYK
jgi:hypothetical protein